MILKKNLFHFSLFTTCLLCFSSCEQEKKIDTKAIVREVKNREIKRVTPSEIIEKVNNEGAETVAKIEKNWVEALHSGIESHGKEYTKKFCIVPFIPGFDTIAQHGTTIKKIGKSYLKHKNKLEPYEKDLFEAYEYNVEHQLPLKPNTQKKGEKYLLYTSPILVNDKICLTCHSENQGFTDFSMGGFAGMWSITLPKKAIIQKIE